MPALFLIRFSAKQAREQPAAMSWIKPFARWTKPKTDEPPKARKKLTKPRERKKAPSASSTDKSSAKISLKARIQKFFGQRNSLEDNKTDTEPPNINTAPFWGDGVGLMHGLSSFDSLHLIRPEKHNITKSSRSHHTILREERSQSAEPSGYVGQLRAVSDVHDISPPHFLIESQSYLASLNLHKREDRCIHRKPLSQEAIERLGLGNDRKYRATTQGDASSSISRALSSIPTDHPTCKSNVVVEVKPKCEKLNRNTCITSTGYEGDEALIPRNSSACSARMQELIKDFDKDVVSKAKQRQASLQIWQSNETWSDNDFVNGGDDDINLFRPLRSGARRASKLQATAAPALTFMSARTIYEIVPTMGATLLEGTREPLRTSLSSSSAFPSMISSQYLETGWNADQLSADLGTILSRDTRDIVGNCAYQTDFDSDEMSPNTESPLTSLKHKRAFTNLKDISISSFGSSIEVGRRVTATTAGEDYGEFDDLRVSPLHITKGSENSDTQRRFWLCPELHKEESTLSSPLANPIDTTEEKRASRCQCLLDGVFNEGGHRESDNLCFCTPEEASPSIDEISMNGPVLGHKRQQSSGSTASIKNLVRMIDKSITGFSTNTSINRDFEDDSSSSESIDNQSSEISLQSLTRSQTSGNFDISEDEDDSEEWWRDTELSSPRREIYARPATPTPPSPTKLEDTDFRSHLIEMYARPDTPTPPSPPSPTKSSSSSSKSTGSLETMIKLYLDGVNEDDESEYTSPCDMDEEEAERWSNFSEDGQSGLVVAETLTPLNTPGFEYYDEVYDYCADMEPTPKKAGAKEDRKQVRFSECVALSEYSDTHSVMYPDVSVEEMLSEYGLEECVAR
ncbi:hypothetical protein NKR23_g348 [Pleurostoma richardsiae]|uniref:Uncharacterized protein n=1 Tax=Pleurostoma richardsiae TaxID=41990 RepID=A0AA38VXW4_9PEZI|nr:hypothetical protein NKR23_g348 [Pleurostoma richardsiae]